MLRTTKLVAVSAALILAAGCGGSSPKKAESSDTSSATASPTGTPLPLEPSDAPAAAALKAYLDAFAVDDAAKACSLQSPKFSQFQVERAIQTKFLKKGATCVQLVTKAMAEAKKAGGNVAALAKAELSLISHSATKVTLRVDFPAPLSGAPTGYAVVKIGGRWLVDSQEDVPGS